MEFNPNTLLLLGMSPDKIKKMSSHVVIPQPDYTNDVLTKTEPRMSEDEYEKAIQEQARKDALAGVGRLESDASMTLKREYVSTVSPDRKGIISATIRKTSTFSAKTQIVTYASFADSQGRQVATYASNQGKWYSIGTPEEGTRERQFNSIYWKAYQEALDGKNGFLNIDNM